MPEPLIKICGLSTPEAVDAAVDARATHIGLVHYPASPRHVTLEQGAALRARVPQGIRVVLLLVNEQPQPTAQAIQAIKPDVVQFHGSETPEWLALLRQHTPLEIWKAIGVQDTASLERAQRYKDAAHRILYDAPAKKLPGGTGLTFDWSLLANFQHTIPWGLAGGLTPDTVADAIRQTGAALVDTSSGVESAPGVKDVDKIAAFCQAARSA
ncbi:MAG TPA: phosphoribosylanthranilate isomerase [Croceibacterium sp.]|nr:phosphoribosylanthranilate isomerase [Croceibacterium sp.]